MKKNFFLYIEDDPSSCKVINFLLKERLGYPLVIFEDSSNFKERLILLEPRPTVILMDIHIQPYDGFVMIDILHNLPEFEETRIIAITASVMSDEIKELKKAGFDGCIAKPINIDTFPNILERILHGEAYWSIK